MERTKIAINENPLAQAIHEDYTTESLVLVIKGSLFKVPDIFNHLNLEGHQKANLGVNAALRELVKRAHTMSKDSHPLVYLESAGIKPQVKITTGGISVAGEIGKLEVVAGTVIPKNMNPAEVVNTVVVADTMAIAHVQDKNGGIEQKFTEKSVKELQMQVPFVPRMLTQWGSVPIWNANSMYRSMMESRNKAITLEYSVHMAQKLPDAQVKKLEGKQLDYIVNKRNYKGRLVKMGSWIPRFYEPKNEFQAWKVLSSHRTWRGVDGKGISALFAGYYYFSVPRSLDKLVWQVVDIMSVLRTYKSRSVVIPHLTKHANINVVHSLIANNIVVYMDKDELPSVHEQNLKHGEEIPAKMYRNDRGLGLIKYIPDPLYGIPSINDKAITWPTTDADVKKIIKAWMQRCNDAGVIEFRYVYLRDALAEWQDHILPSMHVHAAHVLLVSEPVKYVIPGKDGDRVLVMKDHYIRLSAANAYKTAFPMNRIPFSRWDFARSKVLDEGITIIREKLNTEQNEVLKMILFEEGMDYKQAENAPDLPAWDPPEEWLAAVDVIQDNAPVRDPGRIYNMDVQPPPRVEPVQQELPIPQKDQVVDDFDDMTISTEFGMPGTKLHN